MSIDFGPNSVAAVDVRAPGVLGPVAASVSKYARLLLLTVATFLLPAGYAFFGYGADGLWDLQAEHVRHIVINVSANLTSCIVVLNVRGRLAYKLKVAILVCLGTHVLVMAAILGFRLYYSRSIMLSALLASLALTNCMVLVSELTRTRRTGIVPQDNDPELIAWIGSRAQIIPSIAITPSTYDLLLVDFSRELDPSWIRYISNAMLSGIEIRHLAEYVEELLGRASPDHFRIDHIIPRRPRFYLHAKQILDVFVVLLLLPIAVPMALVAALAILITMGRPVLFVQERVGLRGKIFRMYKFRTMREFRKPLEVTKATAANDSRITPLGRWLRRYRIDELPQLWNVLRGDMSVVGPRPEQPPLCDKYAALMATFSCRHVVRPGITGWAQVRYGYASDARETRDKLSYDLYYAKYMSFVLDLMILLETVLIIIHDRTVR